MIQAKNNAELVKELIDLAFEKMPIEAQILPDYSKKKEFFEMRDGRLTYHKKMQAILKYYSAKKQLAS